jgi:hypothetical protein
VDGLIQLYGREPLVPVGVRYGDLVYAGGHQPGLAVSRGRAALAPAGAARGPQITSYQAGPLKVMLEVIARL